MPAAGLAFGAITYYRVVDHPGGVGRRIAIHHHTAARWACVGITSVNAANRVAEDEIVGHGDLVSASPGINTATLGPVVIHVRRVSSGAFAQVVVDDIAINEVGGGIER